MWVTTLFLAAPAANAWVCEREYDGPCTPVAYDELLAKMDDGLFVYDGPHEGWIPQMFPGTSEVMAPGEALLERRGEIFTAQSPGSEPWFTEDWVLRQPHQILNGWPMEASFCCRGSLNEALPYYQSLPDAHEYGIITFKFQYKAPPADSLHILPESTPHWVTTMVFKVYTVDGGVEMESGALYRERGDFNGVVDYRDVWMLWGNYRMPSPEFPVTTRIEPAYTGATLKSFLKDQIANHPESRYVRTERQRVWPLP